MLSPLALSLFLALLSNLAFSSASLIYTTYSRRFSSLWMNTVKTSVAFFGALLFVPIWWPLSGASGTVVGLLMLSGFVGLMLGDWFLLRAFALLGTSPALMIFAFQPLMLALWEVQYFGREVSLFEIGAVGCLILCLYLFSWDQKKRTDSWNLIGLALGLGAVVLDALGVIISKWAFETQPDLSAGESHLWRCGGAFLGFVVAWLVVRRGPAFWASWGGLARGEKNTLLLASFLGTFLALLFYLWALKWGEMSLVAAVAVTGPLFASLLEHLIRKAWPTPAMWWATGMFVLGFSMLVLSPVS